MPSPIFLQNIKVQYRWENSLLPMLGKRCGQRCSLVYGYDQITASIMLMPPKTGKHSLSGYALASVHWVRVGRIVGTSSIALAKAWLKTMCPIAPPLHLYIHPLPLSSSRADDLADVTHGSPRTTSPYQILQLLRASWSRAWYLYDQWSFKATTTVGSPTYQQPSRKSWSGPA